MLDILRVAQGRFRRIVVLESLLELEHVGVRYLKFELVDDVLKFSYAPAHLVLIHLVLCFSLVDFNCFD